MTKAVEHSDVGFEEAVLLLAGECLQLFFQEAAELEISLWAEEIPRRFPQFELGRLLEAVKKRLNAKMG